MSARVTFEHATITGLVRMRGSRNGNPRYWVTTADGFDHRTKPDSMVAYELPNFVGRAVVLWIDGRGNVYSVTDVPGAPA